MDEDDENAVHISLKEQKELPDDSPIKQEDKNPNFKDKVFSVNEEKVLNAVKELLASCDDIEIFNKKAIYLYLRELTGLNTKQVVNNLNKLRIKYRQFKTRWNEGEI